MTAKKRYEGIGGDDFGRFDKAMRGLLSVLYEETQKEQARDVKKKARKKRATTKSSERDISRDSGEVLGAPLERYGIGRFVRSPLYR